MNLEQPNQQQHYHQNHQQQRGGRRRGGNRGRGGQQQHQHQHQHQQANQGRTRYNIPADVPVPAPRAALQPRDQNAAPQQQQRQQEMISKKQQPAAAAAAAARDDEYEDDKYSTGANNTNAHAGGAGGGSKAARQQQQQRRGGNKVRNTLVMAPQHEVPHVRILCDPSSSKLSMPLTDRDIVLAPGVFGGDARDLYGMLNAELRSLVDPQQGGIFEADKLMQPWHGNSHLILNDHLYAKDVASGKKVKWTDKAPVFKSLVDRLASFFNMTVNQTRLNHYGPEGAGKTKAAADESSYKPLHHDAAAVNPSLAAKQNFTVGLSLGATRVAMFERSNEFHPVAGGNGAERAMLDVVLPDKSVYCFSGETNRIWRHGIRIVKGTSYENLEEFHGGRFSVILWGYSNQAAYTY